MGTVAERERERWKLPEWTGSPAISTHKGGVLVGMRKIRQIRVGATYHVVARANRNEFILQYDAVKQMFLDTISRAKAKYDFQLINVCIMDNHFHLLIKPAELENISRIMQWILSVFALKYNRAFALKGHVWYDRFKSKIVWSFRQFIATFKYIDDNPVKAGIVERASAYRYGGAYLMHTGLAGILGPPSRVVQMFFPYHGCRSIGS